MRHSLRRARPLVLAFVVSFSLAACGGKDASTTTPDGDSASVADGAGTDGDTGGGTLTRSTFNERMFKAIEEAGSAHVRFETRTSAGTFGGDGDVQYGDELALRMKMAPPGGSGTAQEVLLIGDTFYVGMGEQYMAMSIDAMAGQGMPDLSTNLDPKIQAKAFESAVTSFEQSGEAETIDGVKATPYDITIDPAKAPDTFGTAVTEPLRFTYYVGPDDLPRRMIYHDKNGEFTATYTQWGVRVDIEAPPDDRIMKGMG